MKGRKYHEERFQLDVSRSELHLLNRAMTEYYEGLGVQHEPYSVSRELTNVIRELLDHEYYPPLVLVPNATANATYEAI